MKTFAVTVNIEDNDVEILKHVFSHHEVTEQMIQDWTQELVDAELEFFKNENEYGDDESE